MVYIRIQAEADVTLLVDEFLKMEIFRQEQAASFVLFVLFVCLFLSFASLSSVWHVNQILIAKPTSVSCHIAIDL